MGDAGSVDYGEIREDYAFFLAHSTETSAQIAALMGHMAWLGGLPPPMRLLDFGCGTGAFAEHLVARAGLPRDALAICLVEPVTDNLAEAAARLAPLAREVTPMGQDAEWGAGPRFELILANHSLYYVPDPAQAVGRLLAALVPRGRLVAALLDRDNALARLWGAGFAAAGAAFPFPLAEDIEAILHRHGVTTARDMVEYRIAFPDGVQQRRSVLRFLFGSHLSRLPPDAALALFDPYRSGSRIVIETAYPHIVVRADSSPGP